jgi:NAD(P)H-hydrate epimerase
VPTGEIVLTREQVRRLDALAEAELGIPTILLMEHAAMAVCRVVLEMIGGGTAAATVLVLAGPGNNGGDGIALARLLVGAGHRPIVACAAPAARYAGDARVQLDIAVRMGIPVVHLPPSDPSLVVEMFVAANPPDPVVVVDGLLGTGAAAPVREPVASVVRWINGQQRRMVVAIDVPTGLDADTGAPMGDAEDVVVRATRTVTLGAMKPGLMRPEAQKYVGRVTVCDLGLPRALIERASR